jgi:hypothetical protein
MKLTERINSNPYLKVSNCTDIADVEHAMDELRKLDAEFGANRKTLLKLWAKFFDKKKKLEAKASTSNYDTSATAMASFMNSQDEQKTSSPMHPIFEQALKPITTTMKNLRVSTRRKSVGDVWGTGDSHSIQVYDVVRDYDSSDIYDKQRKRGDDPASYFTPELIKKGVTIETLDSFEHAEVLLNALTKQTKVRYYLFGTEAVIAFEENGAEGVDLKNVMGAIYRHDEGENPASILIAYDGWFNFIEITEEDFNTIISNTKKGK